MTTNELLSKQQSLTETRSRVRGELETALRDLDALTDGGTPSPEATAQLVALQGEASNLTGIVARLDRSLEDVDRQLRAAQVVADRAALLDSIEGAARAALEGTATERGAYATLAGELEAVLDRFIAAREGGNRARTHLRALLKSQTPALGALFYWGAVTPAQEAAAQRLEAELRAQGVDVASALNASADLPYGALLAALLEAYARETSRTPLEAV